MNRLWKLFRLGLSACALAALPWAAPRPQAAARRDSPIVHITQVDESQFPTLKVYISVTDSGGEPVGVAPTHLRLAENDVEVKPGQVSGQGEIGPLTTLLIMDASGDMNQAGKLTLAQIAAHAHIDQMHVNDRAGVLAFNTGIDYVQPVTTDRVALAKAIDDLKAQGDTPIYGTLLRGVQILESLPGRKAIVLLTDGLDNRSTNTVDQIFERIGPGGLFISTIGLGDPSQLGISTAALDEAALKSLAERAGGNYAYGEDPEALRNLYKRLGHALPNEYMLRYNSPDPLRDGVKRTLTVSLVEEGTATEAEYTPSRVVPEESARTPVQADANLARVMRAIEHLAPEWEIMGGALAGLLVMLCVARPIRRVLIVRRGQPAVGNQVGRQWSRARSHDPASRTSPPPDNPDTSLPVFPNYLQLRPQSRFSLALWEALWASARGHSRVSRVKLKDGRTIPCGVFLVAVGIQPNVDLAREAGLDVNRGVLVDEAMRTNAPDIFAAGDVCELAQQVPGLWPVAVEQAKVAAINAVGGQAVYQGVVPVTMLKVVGVDVSSIGRFEAQSASEIEVVLEDPDGHGYRKLVIAGGKIVGAILLGHPLDVPAVTAAVKEGRDVSDCLNALRARQWDILNERHPGGRLARFRAPYAGTSIMGGRSRSAISSTSRE